MDFDHIRLNVSFELNNSFVFMGMHQLEGLTKFVWNDEIEPTINIFFSFRGIGYSKADFASQMV
jgi:hypothetical protein